MYDDVINTICGIERSIDTNALTYGGVSYWPVCRLRLWSRLTGMQLNAGDKSDLSVTNTGPTFDDVGTVNAFPIGKPHWGLLGTDKAAAEALVSSGGLSPDIVFFLRPEEYRDQVYGARFAKMLDSVFERAGDYTCLKLELANPKTMMLDRHFGSTFLHLDTTAQSAKFDPPHDLAHFRSVEPTLNELCGNGVISSETIAEDMGKIFYFARLFEVVLQDMAPRAVFLSVYYHPVGFALMLAAHRLNIPTVDVQHGRLGPHHGLYTQMTAAPAEGYALVPDHIWCWGSKTKQDIEVDKNPACPLHGGIVGGNPWLDRWKANRDETGLPESVQNLLTQSEGQKKILVSLQPIEVPLPVHVIEAMAAAPADWTWWLRVHPLRRHTIPEIKAILLSKGIENFEIEASTESPLFCLLDACDHHITAFSSVAMEALAFGTTTTLFSTVGEEIFDDYVKRSLFSVALTADALVERVVSALNQTEIQDESPFIDNTPGLAEAALAYTLNTSSS